MQLATLSAGIRAPVFPCVAQLVRVVDRQSKDSGSNPGTVEDISFTTESFQILLIWLHNISGLVQYDSKTNNELISLQILSPGNLKIGRSRSWSREIVSSPYILIFKLVNIHLTKTFQCARGKSFRAPDVPDRMEYKRVETGFGWSPLEFEWASFFHLRGVIVEC